MSHDRNGLEILTSTECTRLLSTARVGRLGLSVGALPVVLPVNFALMDGTVVVRTGPGTKLDAALTDAVVAFEVDQLDDDGETGWSVLLRGVATMITDPAELARARSLDLRPWAGGPKDNYIKISNELISGRRSPQREGERSDAA